MAVMIYDGVYRLQLSFVEGRHICGSVLRIACMSELVGCTELQALGDQGALGDGSGLGC